MFRDRVQKIPDVPVADLLGRLHPRVELALVTLQIANDRKDGGLVRVLIIANCEGVRQRRSRQPARVSTGPASGGR